MHERRRPAAAVRGRRCGGRVDTVVLLGMGGSSARARRCSGGRSAARRPRARHDASRRRFARSRRRSTSTRTLFVSASKSGSTLETRSHTDYFWERPARRAVRRRSPIPGSTLEGSRRSAGSGASSRATRRSAAATPRSRLRDGARGADGRRRRRALLAGARRWPRLPARRRQPGLRARPRVRRGLAEGRDKICIARHAGRLRPVGRAADRRVDRQARQGADAGAGRAARGPGPAGGDSAAPRQYALGGEFFRWEFAVAVAGATSGSIPSTSPTCRRRRTRRTRCSPPARSPSRPQGSVEELFAQARPGDYVCVQAFVNPTTRTTAGSPRSSRACAAGDRLRRHPRLRPAVPPLDGPAAQGRPDTGLFLQVVDDPGDELPIPGKPFGSGG